MQEKIVVITAGSELTRAVSQRPLVFQLEPNKTYQFVYNIFDDTGTNIYSFNGTYTTKGVILPKLPASRLTLNATQPGRVITSFSPWTESDVGK